MPIERVIAAAIFVLSAVLTARLGPSAVRAWRMYAGTGRRRQEDAAGRAPIASPGIVDRLDLLAGLGYHLIGQTRLELPVGERFGWIVAAADAESYAILAGSSSTIQLTGIYTAWPDGTWLGTLHPVGTPSDRGGRQVRIVPTTLADAVREHRAGVDRLRQVHGPPRTVRTMPDMLAHDDDYRTRFGGSRLRPITLRIVIPALIAGASLMLSLVLFVTLPS